MRRVPAHLLKLAGRSLANRLLWHSGVSLDGLLHSELCLLAVMVEQAWARMSVAAQEQAEAAVAEADEVDTLAEDGGVAAVDSESSQVRNRDSLADSRAGACHMVEVEAVRCC